MEYAEAAEDLAAEQKRRQKNKPAPVVKHKKRPKEVIPWQAARHYKLLWK